jgi:hypothetical protein
MSAPQQVELKRTHLESYRRIVGEDELARIRELAAPLRGRGCWS